MHLGNITKVKIVGSVAKKAESMIQPEKVQPGPNEVSVQKYEHDMLLEDLKNLEALRDTVKKFGLTRSLLSFVNRNNILTAVIPEIPALEDFLADKSAKNSIFVVEAIESKISEARQTVAEYTEKEATFFISEENILLNSVKKDFENLSALLASVKKYGLTRSLLSFVDHDKTLSSYIPEIPSIESLEADRSPKNSTNVIVALEGKVVAIEKHLSDKEIK